MNLPPTTTIADVLALGRHTAWLVPPLSRFSGRGSVCGRAVTVRLAMGASPEGRALDPLYDLVSGNLTGAVVVIAGADTCAGAPWGQILSRAAAGAGAVAAVVGGGVRDIAALDGEGLSVWGRRAVTVGAGGMLHVDAVGTPLRIADAIVAPGDLIVGDDSGLVAVPGDISEQVLADARRLATAEEELLSRLTAGEKLVTAYDAKRSVVTQIGSSH